MHQRKKYKSLDEVFGDDEFHLIDDGRKLRKVKTTDQRLVDSFEEINKFLEEHGRLPEDNMSNIAEFELNARLNGFKNNPDKIAQLKELDIHNLLPEVKKEQLPKKEESTKEITSFDDIFEDDFLSEIEPDDAGLFDLKHVKKPSERKETDFVAKRKSCENFDKYEHLFKQVHRELREGSRKLLDFKQADLKEGGFYVHNGVLLNLVSVEWTKAIQSFKSGKLNRPDGRTFTVFENGTESQMMFQSLYKALHENGKSITENSERAREDFLKNFGTVNKDDEYGGYIYILQSKSQDKYISSIKNLYKVGFCSTTVEQRIKDAHKQPTYLMSPVKHVTSWKCFNMDANTFEGLLHKLFGDVRLDVTVTDLDDKKHQPREWFILPLEVIEQAVNLIMTGQIVNYSYDNELKQLVII